MFSKFHFDRLEAARHVERGQPVAGIHPLKGFAFVAGESSLIGRLKRWCWRVLLCVVALFALVVLVFNPELAALSFLFDPIILDVAILFLGTQMLMFNGQIRSSLAGMWSNAMRRFKGRA